MSEHLDPNPKLDFKAIILRFWRYRWFFMAIMVLCFIYTYFHNQFTQTIYQNSIQMSIDLQERRSKSRNERFQSIDFSYESSNLENELGKMNSFPLVKSTLSELDYQVSYHLMEPPFKVSPLQRSPYRVSRELFENLPFEVNFYRSHDQLINTRFFIFFLSESRFSLHIKANKAKAFNYIDDEIKNQVGTLNIRDTFKYGEVIDTDHYKFYVNLKAPSYKPPDNRGAFYFTFHHMDSLALNYLNRLTIEPTSPTSSLINITLTGPHYKKITEFLNALAQAYIKRDLQDKNRQARSTIDFIENQIADVATALSYTGNTLERFRSEHRIIDLDFQGQNIYERLNDLESEKASMIIQKKYYEEIRNYIQNNKVSELVAPSSMNINDPNLNMLISRVTELNSERKAVARRSRKNLFEENLNERIENLKKTILENVNTNLKNIDISLDDMDYRIEKLSGELSALPAKELRYQAIKRKFELNDEIYTYLLTKRAEAQIAQASNFPAYEIVDPARNLDYEIISPRTKLNYILALLAGIFLPASFILVRDFLNTKIRSTSDVENLTNLPIMGNIAHTRKISQENGMTKFSNHLISESIRILRTEIQMLNGQLNQIILITSSRSNEGKTFSAINLARSFSLLNKKTLLVGSDLRKPKLAKLLNLPDEKGMSTFLAGVHSTIEEIIHYTDNPYLDVIPEGPLPPYPTELIASSNTRSLLEYVRSIYEYIVIDTSPIGIVPDSKLLMKFSDINLLMVRQSKTKKIELINTLKNLKKHKVNNFHIVLNDYSPKNDQFDYLYKYYSDQPKNKAHSPVSRTFMQHLHQQLNGQ